MTADQAQPSVAAAARRYGPRLLPVVAGLLPILIGALLVEILFEAWLQELLGDRQPSPRGPVGALPEWPKDLKNGLILLLAVTSVAKIALERRWRDFRTRADLAAAVLVAVMVLAGIIGGSPPSLIGAAVYVYLRGAIVFYAWRAWNPPWRQVTPLLWLGGVVIGLNVLAAAVQMVLGYPAVVGMGWVDTTWVLIHRAQGFTDHPNHLGHIVGLALLGVLAFISGRPRVGRRWWFAVAALALALSASQSRESFLGVLIGAGLIWFLRRGGGRTIAISSAVIIVLFLGHLAVRPENLNELARRLVGVADAIAMPSGTENCDPPTPACTERTISSREIRVLYAQQGMALLERRPVLGYGVGQFGGIVAFQHDPHWYEDPRFGPGGFNTYGFSDVTVDSFWLHLGVETGVIGLLAYLVWLWLLIAPLVRATPRRAGRRPRSSHGPRGPTTDERGRMTALWAVAAVVFSVIVAALSPALEDPLFPPLLFSVLGIAWVVGGVGTRRGTPGMARGRDLGHGEQPRSAV